MKNEEYTRRALGLARTLNAPASFVCKTDGRLDIRRQAPQKVEGVCGDYWRPLLSRNFQGSS